MTERPRRALRRLDAFTSWVFSPALSSLGEYYAALARRAHRG